MKRLLIGIFAAAILAGCQVIVDNEAHLIARDTCEEQGGLIAAVYSIHQGRKSPLTVQCGNGAQFRFSTDGTIVGKETDR